MIKMEDRKQQAIDYIKSHRTSHSETSYGPDCQVYEHNYYVVPEYIAEHAIEIALGED